MSFASLPGRVWNRLRRSPAVQQALVPFGYIPKPDRWIFIVGSYNSGTTLLNSILSTHEQISGLQCEGVVLSDALPRPEEFGWTRMWSQCLEKIRMDPGPGMNEKARRIKRQWSFSYPQVATNLLEKSIANTARIPFLNTYFQPAYFIYLVRNGYAVAEGIRRKADPARWNHPVYENAYPIELCAEQWKVTDQIVKQDRKAVDRFLQIHYEELTSDPQFTIRRITDFLGIEFINGSKLEGIWKTHGYDQPIRNMNPGSYARLSSRDIDKIEGVAGALLNRYGYERPERFD